MGDLVNTEKAAFELVWKSMQRAIRQMALCDSDYYCISCNTLHILGWRIRNFLKEENIKGEFLSVIGETVDVIKARVDTHEMARGKNPMHEASTDSATNATLVPPSISAQNDALNVCILGSLPVTDSLKLSPYRAVLELNG